MLLTDSLYRMFNSNSVKYLTNSLGRQKTWLGLDLRNTPRHDE